LYKFLNQQYNHILTTLKIKSRSKSKSKYKVIEDNESPSLLVTERVEAGSWKSLGLDQPLVIAMVGLPARGKSYIVKMLRRYLVWNGYEAEVFNVGSYRRKMGLAGADATFFASSNADASRKRDELALAVQQDMYRWLKSENQNTEYANMTL
jgi:hypothetical protein